MTQSDHDRRVDYIEFGATDVGGTKQFYQQVFGWQFQDYGPDYTSFQDGRVSGGFTKDAPVRPANPLVVIYAMQLEAIEAKIKQAGGKIVLKTYPFPGGRRFHFTDPSGNQLAVVGVARFALWKMASLFLLPLLMLAFKVALIVAFVMLAVWFFKRNDKPKDDTTAG